VYHDDDGGVLCGAHIYVCNRWWYHITIPYHRSLSQAVGLPQQKRRKKETLRVRALQGEDYFFFEERRSAVGTTPHSLSRQNYFVFSRMNLAPKGDTAIFSSSMQPSNPTEDDLLQLLSRPTGFSVAKYLNTALSPSDDIQAQLAQLALQLQFQTTACHEEIGKLGAELRAIVPRCHADVGRLNVGLQGLEQDASALQQASQTAMGGNSHSEESAAASSLETLSTLHALQANLSRTREILTAAATWDETLAAMPTLLAQGAAQLPAAVAQLAKLSKGEVALRGMPNPEERTAALKKARQQVAALLQPQLAHALQSMQARLGPLQQCVQLYGQLDMLDQLQEAYVRHRPAALHKLWFDYQMPLSSSSKQSTSQTFSEWLPTWFEAVLQLLQEERRQAATVFGPAVVPGIMVAVWSQALQPVLSSLANRLSSQSAADRARIYEACLQFGSLAYDLVATVYWDLAEQEGSQVSSLPPPEPWELWQELEQVLVKVMGQPLRHYQVEWANMEKKAAVEKALPEAQESLGLVLENISGLEQASMDAVWQWIQDDTVMGDWVPKALGRFRLLRGGYGAPNALSVLDEVIAKHIQDVVVKLQPFLEACQSHLSNFEDSHVTTALSILKVAGWMKQQVEQLESVIKQELSVLHARLDKHIQWLENLPSGKTVKFVLPDSLSTIEINSMLTLWACGTGDETAKIEVAQSALATLERLGAEKMSLVQAHEAVAEFSRKCHVFCFSVCFAVPQLHLAPLSSLEAWKKAASDDALASYGILPQSYITHVGEHVLSLVQALEPFAMDKNSLSLAQNAMGDLHHAAKQPWKELIHALGMDDLAKDDNCLERLMTGKDLREFVPGSLAEDQDEIEDSDDAENAENQALTSFCNAWLDVVGLAVAGRLLERIVRIPTLTARGCEHLNADLNYLVNVLTALGVQGHPHPLLAHMAEMCLLQQDVLLESAQSRDTVDPLASIVSSLEQRLLSMKATN
jgi:hypothetical protein